MKRNHRMPRRAAVLAIVIALVLALCAAQAVAEEGAFASYAAVLRADEALIRAYWQSGFYWAGGDAFLPVAEPHAIALVDILGDETRELIYVARDPMNGYAAGLKVFTYENGAARQVLDQPEWDVIADSGTDYCIYRVEGSDDLYAAVGGNEHGFYRWHWDGSSMQVEKLIKLWDGEDGYWYMHNGQAVDPATYEALLADYPRTPSRILIYTRYADIGDPSIIWDGRDLLDAGGMASGAMTFDEAIALLTGSAADADGAQCEYAAAQEEYAAAHGDAAEQENDPAAQYDDAAQGNDSAVQEDNSAAQDAASAETSTSGDDVGGTAASGLPEAVIEVPLAFFAGGADSTDVRFHADGTFDYSDYEITGVGMESGGGWRVSLDDVQQVSAHGWALRVAQVTGDGEYPPFQPGQTILLVLPGASADEFSGDCIPSLDQEMEGTYGPDPRYYYIGWEESWGVQYLPFENLEPQY